MERHLLFSPSLSVIKTQYSVTGVKNTNRKLYSLNAIVHLDRLVAATIVAQTSTV